MDWSIVLNCGCSCVAMQKIAGKRTRNGRNCHCDAAAESIATAIYHNIAAAIVVAGRNLKPRTGGIIIEIQHRNISIRH